jgi:type II secretory pathway component PulM
LNISKLKPRLKAWNQVLKDLPAPQRRLALALGGLFLVFLVYLVVIRPLVALEASWDREFAQKRQLLIKYQALKENKAKVAQINRDLKNALDQAEGQFLSGANASVAASDLQEILKNLIGAYGVQLTSAKVLQPREVGPYQEVPVQVQITANIGQLLTILYHLEHHKKLLFITELEINSPRGTTGSKEIPPMQINLVVSGVIKSIGVRKGAAA